MAKRRYPTELSFTFMGFNWVIKFLDVTSECFGETDTDSKEVHIYIKNRTEQNVIETLLHELTHVLLFDVSQAIFHYDHDKIYDKEENAVRLTSPRLYHLLKCNPKLVAFIVQNLK